MQYDYLVVGAGFCGCVMAEQLAAAGKKVVLIEKRDHLGGNCYDCLDQAGVLIHQYGPHIFHTKHEHVWQYLSRFTAWLPYRHRVLANYDGQILNLPVNLTTIEQLFASPQAERIKAKLIDNFGASSKIPIIDLQKSQDSDLQLLAQVVFEKVYNHYSQKQWGMPLAELDPQVAARVPIWVDRDNHYFKDSFQGMPKDGYSKMFGLMLKSPNIKVVLGKDYKQVEKDFEYSKMIYTGPIDYFFDYQYGHLPYRSLRFDFETLNQESFQEVAVVNYTSAKESFTRITEFKLLTGQTNKKTTILREYPHEFSESKIPCYPIPIANNFKRYDEYRVLADELANVTFIGRLAEYKYFNMDEVVAQALKVAK